MDPIVVLLIVIVSILTILLVVVGVHVILILRDVRQTIQKVNNTVEGVDSFIHNLHSPFGHSGGIMEGVKTGLKVAEAFVTWLKKDVPKNEQQPS